LPFNKIINLKLNILIIALNNNIYIKSPRFILPFILLIALFLVLLLLALLEPPLLRLYTPLYLLEIKNLSHKLNKIIIK
jgi:hypothetical protein